MAVLGRQLCALSEGLTFVLPVHRFHSIEPTNHRWKILEKTITTGNFGIAQWDCGYLESPGEG